MSKDGFFRAFLSLTLISMFGACASTEKKQRQVVRDQVSASSKFYCEFLNGEKYTDIDIALNIAMGEKCDVSENFSVTGYRSISEIPGVIYCCNLKSKEGNSSKQSRKALKSKASLSASEGSSETVDKNTSSVDTPSEPALEGSEVSSESSPTAPIAKPGSGEQGSNSPRQRNTKRAPAQSR